MNGYSPAIAQFRKNLIVNRLGVSVPTYPVSVSQNLGNLEGAVSQLLDKLACTALTSFRSFQQVGGVKMMLCVNN